MKQYHQDMKGKIILNLKKIGLIAVTGVAAVTLAACGQDGANSDIVTMKGDTIRVSDLYKEAKQYPSTGTATLLQNMTFNKIFEKEFGKKVSEKDVNKEFDTQKHHLVQILQVLYNKLVIRKRLIKILSAHNFC
jgi:foldase protein PrsA